MSENKFKKIVDAKKLVKFIRWKALLAERADGLKRYFTDYNKRDDYYLGWNSFIKDFTFYIKSNALEGISSLGYINTADGEELVELMARMCSTRVYTYQPTSEWQCRLHGYMECCSAVTLILNSGTMEDLDTVPDEY